MAAWLARAGKHGEDEKRALESGLAIIGWKALPDLSKISSKDELLSILNKAYPNSSANRNINFRGQLWSFVKGMKKGDIIVLPQKTRSVVALGRVSGDYAVIEGKHTRKVDWIKDSIPRSAFGQDLLYSFGAFMTVCQIKRNDAEARLEVMIKGGADPHLAGKQASKSVTATDTVTSEEPEEAFIDLEEQAIDQIRRLIQAKFAGHNLARLVEAVLNSQGYQTHRSPEGADAGIDILAGHGPMGFDKPRICVQVKSGGVQNDASIRELEGVMSRVSAEQGLFVSWHGFNRTAEQNRRDLFFKVRLWDDKKLISELLSCYDKLPDEMQAELPMKRIWVVVPEEDQ